MEFKNDRQVGDDWMSTFAKFVILLGTIWVITMLAKACEKDKEPHRVRMGGAIELGDSYSQEE
jgi:hypothetical protein